MRFHWIRDRVRQNQSGLEYIPTKQNIADYTKNNLPKELHDRFTFYLVRDTTNAATKCLIAQRRLLLKSIIIYLQCKPISKQYILQHGI